MVSALSAYSPAATASLITFLFETPVGKTGAEPSQQTQVPSVSTASSPSGASAAIAKIIEIVGNAPGPTENASEAQNASGAQDDSVKPGLRAKWEAFYTRVETPTDEEFRSRILEGLAKNAERDNDVALQQALRDGTVEIHRGKEVGLNYTYRREIHWDGDGNYAGVSMGGTFGDNSHLAELAGDKEYTIGRIGKFGFYATW